jgi:PTH1 family peptidyl-tRNA hydrolase
MRSVISITKANKASLSVTDKGYTVSQIKLIVGLANPGAEYAQTRHNAGAWYVDLLAQRYNQPLKEEAKFFGYTSRLNIVGHDVRLLVPTTFMNLSGKAVVAMAGFFRIAPEEILVAHDELDLPPGVAKLKLGGGNGGHNGLKDIANKLGNNPNFHRLRIGIGHPGDKNKVTGFVLGKPPAGELKLIDDAIDEAVRCTEIILKEDMTKAMNRLHAFKATS